MQGFASDLIALELMQNEKVTYFVGVPLMSYEIASHPDLAKYDISMCKSFAAGGAPRPVEHVNKIKQAFPGGFPLLGYGLTETNAIGCSNGGFNYLLKPASTGRPNSPLIELKCADENGNPGKANELRVVSLEHKMGLHGSPTCVMQYDGATGWLVGKEHGGMAAMFTMMNNARLGVGGQGVGVAEGAYQHALAYALDRKQGRTPEGTGGTIADHADVRRMLTTMKAELFAARSILLSCAVAIDMQTATGQADWAARAAFLTPIAKSFGTETGIRVSETGVQVHGGMGFIEETGAAQYYRDVRVTAIYEGTNGIQAMDLVGRKMMDGGEAASNLIDEMQAQAEKARDKLPDLAEAVWEATESLREATEWLTSRTDMNDRFAGAVPYLNAFARVLGGHFHLSAALAEPGGAREALARFYITRLLPEHVGLLAHAEAGAKGLYGLSLDDLAA